MSGSSQKAEPHQPTFANEDWNHPPDGLHAVREGDGWRIRLRYRLPDSVNWFLTASIGGLGFYAVVTWLDAVGTVGQVCLVLGWVPAVLVLLLAIQAVTARLGTVVLVLQPTSVRVGRQRMAAHEIGTVEAQHNSRRWTDKYGRPRTMRLPVLRLGWRRMNVHLEHDELEWIAGAVELIRRPPTEADHVARTEVHAALDPLRQPES